MKKVNEKLGTNYDLFNYYGAPDAERVIVAMGSILRRGRGGYRLPEREGREGRSGQGSPVSSVRHEEIRRMPARNREENRRARPHEGAWLHWASLCTSTWSTP